MALDTHPIMEHAEELLRRLSPQARAAARRARDRRRRAALRRMRMMMLAALAVALAVVGWGLAIGPVGPFGLFVAIVATALAWTVLLAAARRPPATPAALATTDLAQLPQRTEAWLEAQRPALPAPAVRLIDGIGVRLEGLGAQLAGLSPGEPAAIEVRKLIGEELPELIGGYRRVPEALRREPPRNGGPTPDRQLVQGLELVDSELKRMAEQLAGGELDKLATQRRYLELKYRGTDGLDAGDPEAPR